MWLALAVVGASLARAAAPGEFDVRTYGAKGDGRALDTKALQGAIDACAEAGGGSVVLPPGRYLSGTLVLGSHVHLRLGAGATLLGSTRMADYREPHLIVARNAEDIAITGEGTIDGQGDSFFGPDLQPKTRPSPLLEFEGCRELAIEGLHILKAPGWTVHPKDCEGVDIRGIVLLNNLLAVNTDGLDIDSSRNVTVSDCRIEAGDDCIVLKTTERGGAATPTENVVVSNCVLRSAASALKLGTESHADFRHCLFSNCVITDSRTGIALLAKDGGAMEDIAFSQISISTRPKWGKGLEWPIVIDTEQRSAKSGVSHLSDIRLTDVSLSTRGRVLVEGTPESPIQGLVVRGLQVHETGFETIAGAHKLRGGAQGAAEGMPDYGAEPAALIFAHVRGLLLDACSLSWPSGASQPRKAAYFDDVAAASLANDSLPSSQPGLPPYEALHSPGFSP